MVCLWMGRGLSDRGGPTVGWAPIHTHWPLGGSCAKSRRGRCLTSGMGTRGGLCGREQSRKGWAQA